MGTLENIPAAKTESLIGALHGRQYLAFGKDLLPPVCLFFFLLLLPTQFRFQLIPLFGEFRLRLRQMLTLTQIILILAFLGLTQFAGSLRFRRQRLQLTVQTDFLLFQSLEFPFRLTKGVAFVHNYLQLVKHQIPRLMDLPFQCFNGLISGFQ